MESWVLSPSSATSKRRNVDATGRKSITEEKALKFYKGYSVEKARNCCILKLARFFARYRIGIVQQSAHIRTTMQQSE